MPKHNPFSELSLRQQDFPSGTFKLGSSVTLNQINSTWMQNAQLAKISCTSNQKRDFTPTLTLHPPKWISKHKLEIREKTDWWNLAWDTFTFWEVCLSVCTYYFYTNKFWEKMWWDVSYDSLLGGKQTGLCHRCRKYIFHSVLSTVFDTVFLIWWDCYFIL